LRQNFEFRGPLTQYGHKGDDSESNQDPKTLRSIHHPHPRHWKTLQAKPNHQVPLEI
jgi:hypothetical protein